MMLYGYEFSAGGLDDEMFDPDLIAESVYSAEENHSYESAEDIFELLS